jgi:hypothetical protein
MNLVGGDLSHGYVEKNRGIWTRSTRCPTCIYTGPILIAESVEFATMSGTDVRHFVKKRKELSHDIVKAIAFHGSGKRRQSVSFTNTKKPQAASTIGISRNSGRKGTCRGDSTNHKRERS